MAQDFLRIKNPTLTDALRVAQSLGLEIRYPNASGDVLIVVPGVTIVRCNNRRSDTPRKLWSILRQLVKKSNAN